MIPICTRHKVLKDVFEDSDRKIISDFGRLKVSIHFENIEEMRTHWESCDNYASVEEAEDAIDTQAIEIDSKITNSNLLTYPTTDMITSDNEILEVPNMIAYDP